MPPPQEPELYQGDSFVPELASSNGTRHRFTDPARNRALSAASHSQRCPGARPVIEFSYGGRPRSECSFGNAQWGEALASAGCVVIQSPTASMRADRAMACNAVGVPNCSEVTAMRYLRPGDVSAVISQILAIATWFGLPERIDAGARCRRPLLRGLYRDDGSGATVDLGMLKGKSFADSRIVSAMALSPQGRAASALRQWWRRPPRAAISLPVPHADRSRRR
ncbi:MAG: hypothetical protein IPG64_24945 [Haliea sp.]|nr:hypothetical protein [Haliea sp.]